MKLHENELPFWEAVYVATLPVAAKNNRASGVLLEGDWSSAFREATTAADAAVRARRERTRS